MGEVYTTRCPSRSDLAMAYSATTVFPAEVCAATSTDSFRSTYPMAVCWKGSRVKGYVFAGGRFLATASSSESFVAVGVLRDGPSGRAE